MQPGGDYSQRASCQEPGRENTSGNPGQRSVKGPQSFHSITPSLPLGFTENLHAPVVPVGATPPSYRAQVTPRRKQVRRIRLLYPPSQNPAASLSNPPPAQPLSSRIQLEPQAVAPEPSPRLPPPPAALPGKAIPHQLQQRHHVPPEHPPRRYTDNVHDAIAHLQASKQPVLVFPGGPRPVVTTGGDCNPLADLHEVTEPCAQDQQGVRAATPPIPAPSPKPSTKRPQPDIAEPAPKSPEHGPQYFKGLLMVCALLCLASANKAASQAEYVITQSSEFGTQQFEEVNELCARADSSLALMNEFLGLLSVYAPELGSVPRSHKQL